MRGSAATLSKIINMDIWVVGQLFRRGFSTETKFLKNVLVSGKTPFFMISPFCTLHSICLNIGF